MANEWDIVIRKVNNAIQSDKAIRTGITTVLAVQKQRIFVSGQDDLKGSIGTYSASYAKIKQKKGRNPNIVNLQDTGQMFQDYSFHILGTDTYGLGFNNPFNYQKSQWAEQHFEKKIFSQSKEEGIILTRVIEEQLANDLK